MNDIRALYDMLSLNNLKSLLPNSETGFWSFVTMIAAGYFLGPYFSLLAPAAITNVQGLIAALAILFTPHIVRATYFGVNKISYSIRNSSIVARAYNRAVSTTVNELLMYGISGGSALFCLMKYNDGKIEPKVAMGATESLLEPVSIHWLDSAILKIIYCLGIFGVTISEEMKGAIFDFINVYVYQTMTNAQDLFKIAVLNDKETILKFKDDVINNESSAWTFKTTARYLSDYTSSTSFADFLDYTKKSTVDYIDYYLGQKNENMDGQKNENMDQSFHETTEDFDFEKGYGFDNKRPGARPMDDRDVQDEALKSRAKARFEKRKLREEQQETPRRGENGEGFNFEKEQEAYREAYRKANAHKEKLNEQTWFGTSTNPFATVIAAAYTWICDIKTSAHHFLISIGAYDIDGRPNGVFEILIPLLSFVITGILVSWLCYKLYTTSLTRGKTVNGVIDEKIIDEKIIDEKIIDEKTVKSSVNVVIIDEKLLKEYSDVTLAIVNATRSMFKILKMGSVKILKNRAVSDIATIIMDFVSILKIKSINNDYTKSMLSLLETFSNRIDVQNLSLEFFTLLLAIKNLIQTQSKLLKDNANNQEILFIDNIERLSVADLTLQSELVNQKINVVRVKKSSTIDRSLFKLIKASKATNMRVGSNNISEGLNLK